VHRFFNIWLTLALLKISIKREGQRTITIAERRDQKLPRLDLANALTKVFENL